MDAKDLLYRIYGRSRCAVIDDKQSKTIELLAQNMRTVEDSQGNVVLRASLYYDDKIPIHDHLNLSEGMLTIGGLNAGEIRGLVGIVKGYSVNASRNYGMPIVSDKDIAKWASEQSQMLAESWLDPTIQMQSATVVCRLGGRTGDLKCFEYHGGYLSCKELVSYINDNSLDKCIFLSGVAISLDFRRRNETRVFIANPNVFWGEEGTVSMFCYISDFELTMNWPNPEIASEASISNSFMKTLAIAWDTDMETLKENADISGDSKRYEAEIGTFGGESAKYDFVDIFRKPK